MLSLIVLSSEITFFQAPRYKLRQESSGQKDTIPSETSMAMETGGMIYCKAHTVSTHCI